MAPIETHDRSKSPVPPPPAFGGAAGADVWLRVVLASVATMRTRIELDPKPIVEFADSIVLAYQARNRTEVF